MLINDIRQTWGSKLRIGSTSYQIIPKLDTHEDSIDSISDSEFEINAGNWEWRIGNTSVTKNRPLQMILYLFFMSSQCTMQKNTWGRDMAVFGSVEPWYQKEHVLYFNLRRVCNWSTEGEIWRTAFSLLFTTAIYPILLSNVI